jgi:hypothetical protein
MEAPDVQKADEYRKLADEAEKRAEAANQTEIGELHRQLASNWREMADHADSQIGRTTPPTDRPPA